MGVCVCVCVYPGKLVPEQTITHSHIWGRRRRIRRDNKVRCMAAQPLYDVLSQPGLSDPIKPAYNQSRPHGRLKLTVGAFNWLSNHANINPPWGCDPQIHRNAVIIYSPIVRMYPTPSRSNSPCNKSSIVHLTIYQSNKMYPHAYL